MANKQQEQLDYIFGKYDVQTTEMCKAVRKLIAQEIEAAYERGVEDGMEVEVVDYRVLSQAKQEAREEMAEEIKKIKIIPITNQEAEGTPRELFMTGQMNMLVRVLNTIDKLLQKGEK